MTLDRTDDVMITIEGPATIYEVKSLRETLLQGLAAGGDLRLDLGETGKWDLAGLQLMISCVRTAQSQGRTARLLRVPMSCAEVAERSGLSKWLNSVSDAIVKSRAFVEPPVRSITAPDWGSRRKSKKVDFPIRSNPAV